MAESFHFIQMLVPTHSHTDTHTHNFLLETSVLCSTRALYQDGALVLYQDNARKKK